MLVKVLVPRRGFLCPVGRGANVLEWQRRLSIIRVLADGSVRVDDKDVRSDADTAPPPPGHVHVKLRAAPCTPADLRTFRYQQPKPLGSQGIGRKRHKQEIEQEQHRQRERERPPSSFFPNSRVVVGGSEGLWEITATGEGVSSLQPGDLAVPSSPTPRNIAHKIPALSCTSNHRNHWNGPGVTSIVPEEDHSCGAGTGATMVAGSRCFESDDGDQSGGTWRSMATLGEGSLLRVPLPGKGSDGGGGIAPEVLAHVSASVSTAIRVLEDFAEFLPAGRLQKGDRVVLTGASTAVAQMLLQVAATRGLESVCLVSSKAEKERAERLGAWKAAELKEFKAMRMNDACLVADGEGGVLGFTAARALRFRGFYVSYADVSGDGVSVPVAGQIFSDTRCRGFSLSRWSEQRSVEETRALVSDALEAVMAGAFRLEGTREFPLTEAVAAVEAAARIPSGGPVLLRA